MNIEGKYVIKTKDGETVYENMLTSNALLFINQYLSGQVNYWADSIAVGLNKENNTTISTQALDYEIARYPVNFKSYKEESGVKKIILKATIPPESEFIAYEIGVFPSRVDPVTFADHQLITTFSEAENVSVNNTRWMMDGDPALTSADTSPTVPARSGSKRISIPSDNTVTLDGMSVLTPVYLSENVVSILFYSKTAASGSIAVAFGDSSASTNYWTGSVAFSSSDNTYNTASFVMTDKGADFLSPITAASVTFIASASGQIIEMDHMKFMFSDIPTPEISLISRKAASNNVTPLFTKVFSEPMEIEYYIQVT